MLPFLCSCTCDQIVEDVKVYFTSWSARDTVSLEVVFESFDTAQTTAVGELQLCVLSKAGCIRIEDCAGATERLEDKF